MYSVYIMQEYIQQLTEALTKTTNDVELLERRRELKSIIDDANYLLDEKINPTLLGRATDAGGEYFVGDIKVSVVTLTSYKGVPLKFAKKNNATKEVIDTDIMKALIKNGRIAEDKIPGLAKSMYVRVK